LGQISYYKATSMSNVMPDALLMRTMLQFNM